MQQWCLLDKMTRMKKNSKKSKIINTEVPYTIYIGIYFFGVKEVLKYMVYYTIYYRIVHKLAIGLYCYCNMDNTLFEYKKSLDKAVADESVDTYNCT